MKITVALLDVALVALLEALLVLCAGLYWKEQAFDVLVWYVGIQIATVGVAVAVLEWRKYR